MPVVKTMETNIFSLNYWTFVIVFDIYIPRTPPATFRGVLKKRNVYEVRVQIQFANFLFFFTRYRHRYIRREMGSAKACIGVVVILIAIISRSSAQRWDKFKSQKYFYKIKRFWSQIIQYLSFIGKPFTVLTNNNSNFSLHVIFRIGLNRNNTIVYTIQIAKHSYIHTFIQTNEKCRIGISSTSSTIDTCALCYMKETNLSLYENESSLYNFDASSLVTQLCQSKLLSLLDRKKKLKTRNSGYGIWNLNNIWFFDRSTWYMNLNYAFQIDLYSFVSIENATIHIHVMR